MAVASNVSFHLPLLRERTELGQRFLRFAVIALMTISIVAPVVRLSEAFYLKLDQLLLPLVALIYLWLVLAGLARPIRPNGLFVVPVVFCICIALSILYGTQVIGHPLWARDFFELPKTIIPVIFFTLAYEADLSERSLQALLATLFPAILLISFYAYGQWFNMEFTHFLQPYFSGGLHDDGGLAHYRRVYSTLSNPNCLGMLMTWVIVIFALAALFRIGSRLWNVVLLFASLATLTMTGSRSGLLHTAFALGILFFLPAPTEDSNRRRKGILLVSLPILFGAFLVVAMSNQATLDRVGMLGTPLQDSSLRLRLDGLWIDAADKFVESPLIGHGPAKAIYSDVVTDSEYLHILKQYGVLGLLPYLCYFLVPLGMVWKGLCRVPRAGPWLEQQWPASYWAVSVAFVMIVTDLVMNIGMFSFYNYSLMAFLWMWMGIGASCARRLRRVCEFQAKLSQP